MAKMQEEAVAEEIIEFLREHNLLESVCSFYAEDRLDAIYGLAQYLGEEVAE